jgi:hypothetical protein
MSRSSFCSGLRAAGSNFSYTIECMWFFIIQGKSILENRK